MEKLSRSRWAELFIEADKLWKHIAKTRPGMRDKLGLDAAGKAVGLSDAHIAAREAYLNNFRRTMGDRFGRSSQLAVPMRGQTGRTNNSALNRSAETVGTLVGDRLMTISPGNIVSAKSWMDRLKGANVGFQHVRYLLRGHNRPMLSKDYASHLREVLREDATRAAIVRDKLSYLTRLRYELAGRLGGPHYNQATGKVHVSLTNPITAASGYYGATGKMPLNPFKVRSVLRAHELGHKYTSEGDPAQVELMTRRMLVDLSRYLRSTGQRMPRVGTEMDMHYLDRALKEGLATHRGFMTHPEALKIHGGTLGQATYDQMRYNYLTPFQNINRTPYL